MHTPIRILIADDHPVVRFGLTSFLNDEPDIRVIGEAGTAVETVNKLNSLRPDVTLLDLEMGDRLSFTCISSFGRVVLSRK